MRSLELATFPVRDLRLGDVTAYDRRTAVLTVDAGEVRRMVLCDPRLAGLDVDVARPGDPLRIVNVLDVVEPREKVSGTGGVFPGILSPPTLTGAGVTHRLAGAAVVATGVFPGSGDNLLRQENCTVDMSGPGAAYSPFSQTCNLVLSYHLAPGSANAEYDQSLRQATLAVARYLAAATRDQAPAESATYALGPVDPDLPGIAYICEVPTFGLLFRSLFYGMDLQNSLPTCVHPNELMDGAVVGADYHYAGQRTITYFLQNSPVAEELYRGHGVTHRFCGVIVAGHFMRDVDKVRGAEQSARVAEMLGARGTIVTACAGGNALIDALYAGRSCERLKIKSAVVLVEMANEAGDDPGLPDFTAENDLLISVGNREQLVDLPRVERVLGGAKLLGTDTGSVGPMRLPVREILGANNEQGGWRLTARAY